MNYAAIGILEEKEQGIKAKIILRSYIDKEILSTPFSHASKDVAKWYLIGALEILCSSDHIVNLGVFSASEDGYHLEDTGGSYGKIDFPGFVSVKLKLNG